MNLEYDKKKLIILRAVLIAIGAAVGGLAAWQYFVYYPQLVRREFRAVIITVSAVLLGGILGLSAKPFYRLGVSIAELFGGLLQSIGWRGMVGVLAGLAAAGIAVTVFDIVIRGSQSIWAVRLLMDILVYMVFAALCCYTFIRWLSGEDESDDERPLEKVGYLLAAECLSDERSVVAAKTLMNVKVCDGAYKRLLLSGETECAARLERIISGGATLVRTKNGFSDADEYAALERRVAKNKRLRLICKQATEPDDVDISVFGS